VKKGCIMGARRCTAILAAALGVVVHWSHPAVVRAAEPPMELQWHQLVPPAPPFWIRKVDLTFDLDPAKTLVISRMLVERNADVAAAPLKLHGEDLTLTRCLVDGESVSFRHEDGCLVIDNLPEGSFSLEIGGKS